MGFTVLAGPRWMLPWLPLGVGDSVTAPTPTPTAPCFRGGVTTTQGHMRLCESHMTFNKFQTLIAFQSTITGSLREED